MTPRIDYKSTAGIRIIAIGGSTTADMLLDDRRTWAYLLQEKLKIELGRRVEVINTGVSGVRSAHHLATFSRILQYDPDFVLFLVGVNDWNRDITKQFDSLPWLHDGIFGIVFEDTILGALIKNIYDRVKLIVEGTRKRFTKGGDIRHADGIPFGLKSGSLKGKQNSSTFLQTFRKNIKIIL